MASSASNLIHAPAPFGNADAKKQRGDRPFMFTNLRQGEGVEEIVAFIRKQGLLDKMQS
jgi:Ni2+-binding GTPase involved in maturation of urease and hydrogenase